jgi:uncharacterized protein involved in exopolysaccharide biosynthesis
MAQGNLGKLKKAPKSAGSQKRKVVRSKTVQSKGRKQKKARHTAAVESAKPIEQMSKQINRKNEALVAAKAVGAGNRFFLSDIAEQGIKEHKDQIKSRNKKQDKANKMSGRIKDQLEKLEHGTKVKR